jgi:hypothetical protein
LFQHSLGVFLWRFLHKGASPTSPLRARQAR